MVKLQLVLGVVTFALWVFCLVDAIASPSDRVRHLPKALWIILVLFFPLVGSIAWIVAGRPQRGVARRSAHERPAPEFPEYDHPGRAAAVDPAKDEEFLRQVRERAEAQRKAYEEQKRREREADRPCCSDSASPSQPGVAGGNLYLSAGASADKCRFWPTGPDDSSGPRTGEPEGDPAPSGAVPVFAAKSPTRADPQPTVSGPVVSRRLLRNLLNHRGSGPAQRTRTVWSTRIVCSPRRHQSARPVS